MPADDSAFGGPDADRNTDDVADGAGMAGAETDDAYPASMTPITVTVDDEHLAGIADLAEVLRSNGMTIDAVLEIGIITGTVDAAHRTSLGAVPGVLSIDDALQTELPPPDADIQ